MTTLRARLSTAVRGSLGAHVEPLGPRPALPLELYEFEGCPFCRKAREAISMLDLETRIWPCPKGGTRFRPRAVELAGRASFPTLLDPNVSPSEQVMQESDRIVAALFTRYGRGSVPSLLRAGVVGDALSGASSALSGGGSRARPASLDDDASMVLYAHEGQPDAREVKRTLSELELPYTWRPDAIGSARASDASPRLLDGEQTIVGGAAIVAHLERRSGARA